MLAVPFVQGRLRNEAVRIEAESECAHTRRPLHLSVDSELRFQIEEDNADPRVFLPFVDFRKLQRRPDGRTSIIDDL